MGEVGNEKTSSALTFGNFFGSDFSTFGMVGGRIWVTLIPPGEVSGREET